VNLARRWQAAAPRHWTIDCLDDTTIIADAARLTIGIDTLVENAIQHTPEDDLIVIGARCKGDTAVFTVRDNGRGMSAEKLDGLRSALGGDGSEVPRRPGGAGLGLRIARAVCEAHQGRLSVDSGPGVGSEFALHIPVVSSRSEPTGSCGMVFGRRGPDYGQPD
jgi:two-component system OmpR family sensor kinase